jgi:DNA-binding NarL/FixJ family response regulator
MLRILIVDDQKSIRETLKAVLASQPDFKVVATADNGEVAVELAKKLLPDLMLVDLEMPKLDGINLTRLIHHDFPSIKVIVVSIHDQDDYIQQALHAGAMGYLLKNTPSKDLREAIRFVDRGYTQFSPGLLSRLITATEARPALPAASSKQQDNGNSSSLVLSKLKLTNPLSPQPHRNRKHWKFYLPYWLVGNGILWGLAILYLLFKTPVYTSKWSISLDPSQNSNSSIVNIPNLASANSEGEANSNSNIFDLRQDYKFLLGEKEIISIAAAQMGVEPKKFGQPQVEIVDNTSMMRISVEGNTPEVAQQKAIALQTILERKLQSLRQGKANKSDSSPPFQVVIQPSLPEKRTSPNLGLVGLAGLTGSVLLTIAIASIWSNSTSELQESSNNNGNNNHLN